ncbi:MAG: hypothetical protein QXQ87_09465 [Halobacteria archaeon]
MAHLEAEALAPRPIEPSPPLPGPEEDPMDPFHAAIRSPHTRAAYERNLARFLSWAKTDAREFVRLAKTDPKRAEGRIIAYIAVTKKRVGAAGTPRNYLAPIKLLLNMNDATGINWKKLRKTLPLPGKGEDRAPTLDEVRAVASTDDFRVRVAVLFMATGGLRVGGLDGLKVKHVEPVKRGGEVVAAKVKVYAGSRDEYLAFVSPEAWGALESYLDHRRRNGEKVTGESPILRNRYKEGKAGGRVEAVRPPALSSLLTHLYLRLGLRPERAPSGKHHEFAGTHGYRKFFKTRCEQVMRPLNVEMLLGHETGISGHYYRPKESELMEDYLKALPSLAILYPPVMAPEVAGEFQALREEVARLRAEREEARPTLGNVGELAEALALMLEREPRAREWLREARKEVRARA